MKDMTKGSTPKHIFYYAIPILLANWLQLAYNALDSIIAGRFIGKDALAAEGIAGPVMNLLILGITGLCIGAGVKMSEYFGAKKFEELRKSIASLLITGLIASTTLSLICILFTKSIVSWLNVPSEIVDITRIYLQIIFIGMPFTFLYNGLATAYKSIGDSKTPLYFLAFSAVLNCVLDIIFLGIFHFGIVCSATTTVIAEILSAFLAFYFLFKKSKDILPRKDEWVVDIPLLKDILSYGTPAILQQTAQPIGKLLIQSQVNSLGVYSIAAFNAVTKIDEFAFIPEQGIASSTSTFIAQNKGAKNKERIAEGFKYGLMMEVIYGILIGIIVFIFKDNIVSLFVDGEGKQQIVSLGSTYLSYMAFFYILPSLTNGIQGFFRGVGKLYTTILGTLLQIGFRTIFTYVLTPKFDIIGISFACVIGWIFMLAFEIPYSIYTLKKLERVE